MNGLSVADLGDIGFEPPTRITAGIGLGQAVVIDIEREGKRLVLFTPRQASDSDIDAGDASNQPRQGTKANKSSLSEGTNHGVGLGLF